MVERGNRITRTSGMSTWRAGCSGTGTSGSEGGSEKPTSRKAGRALRPDPYTKIAGPHKWTWFHLYVILDVWSRFAVGWLVAPRESARLAEELIAASAHAERNPRSPPSRPRPRLHHPPPPIPPTNRTHRPRDYLDQPTRTGSV
jgi:transposase InsO family protein